MLNRLLICVITMFLTFTSLPLPLGADPSAAGIFAPCPASDNCVTSQGGDSSHTIEPLTYQGDRDKAYKNLLQILTVVPRTTVTKKTDNYIYAESSSRIFHFVDDLAFYFPVDAKFIQIRSAARVGSFDLGVNRRRLEQIRLALRDLTTSSTSTKM
jgi:uncharacterized protein (DUF1499 family)